MSSKKTFFKWKKNLQEKKESKSWTQSATLDGTRWNWLLWKMTEKYMSQFWAAEFFLCSPHEFFFLAVVRTHKTDIKTKGEIHAHSRNPPLPSKNHRRYISLVLISHLINSITKNSPLQHRMWTQCVHKKISLYILWAIFYFLNIQFTYLKNHSSG